jgi:hypothetical protein
MSCWPASIRMIVAARSSSSSINSDDDVAAPTNDQASLMNGLDPQFHYVPQLLGFSDHLSNELYRRPLLSIGPRAWAGLGRLRRPISRFKPKLPSYPGRDGGGEYRTPGPCHQRFRAGWCGVDLQRNLHRLCRQETKLLGTTELAQPSQMYIVYM